MIQARTTSSRLPAKVLLPIAGIPAAVLAAKRAANTGRRVIIATSHDRSDDVLAETIREHGIECHRGELGDVLGRFVGALVGHSDETLVIRLTADNVFPDGALIDEVAAEFVQDDLDYLACDGDESGLPYGMKVEVMTLGMLRYACSNAESEYDREHVTPFLQRHGRCGTFTKYRASGRHDLRCTIDYLEDYLKICRLFSELGNPEVVSAHDLAAHLSSVDRGPQQSGCKRLVLGTAQFGSDYGIVNHEGKPELSEVERILAYALAHGIELIDTASDYGESECRIGNFLAEIQGPRPKCVTKLTAMRDCPVTASDEIVTSYVDASIYRSLYKLDTRCLDVLLLHRADHLHAWGAAVWRRVRHHQARGRVQALGVSVQTSEELVRTLENRDVEYIQMPSNILDWRWDEVAEKISGERTRRSLKIHVRSILLQGLLASTDTHAWRMANVADDEAIRVWLAEQVRTTGRENVTDLCVAYANAIPWADGIVVGVENKNQLEQIAAYMEKDSLTESQVETLRATRPVVGIETLDPNRWRRGC